MVTIRIVTDNDAFKGHLGAARLEVARILEELSWKIRAGARGQSPTLKTTKLTDYNGNHTGEIRLTGSEKRWLT